VRVRRVLALSAIAVWMAAGAAGAAGHDGATLSVWQGAAWRTFWRSDRAPERWNAADSSLTRSLKWQPLAPGLEWASVRLACAAPLWRARLIVARLDPRRLEISLAMDQSPKDLRPAWSLDRAPHDALLAVNAGQFSGAMPWGWVAMEGRQWLRPGYGPLSSAIAIDAAGGVRWFHGDSLLDPTRVVAGFQSYPTLLAGEGRVPAALRAPGSVSLTHRDARLALGQTREGRLLIAMTRYDVIGETAGGLPLGPTTPEMAAIMGALGACDAVMLDGGISAQMLLRGNGHPQPLEWRGIRKVPLALIARLREPGNPAP
jgi:hypothetical protein